MEIRHDEGIANQIGPEPCAIIREDDDEASVGEITSQPLSRIRIEFGADAVAKAQVRTLGAERSTTLQLQLLRGFQMTLGSLLYYLEEVDSTERQSQDRALIALGLPSMLIETRVLTCIAPPFPRLYPKVLLRPAQKQVQSGLEQTK